MANNTPVNSMISDSVSQANVEVLGSSPAVGMVTVYQSLGHSTGMLFETAVGNQQQLAIASQAAANQGIIQIYTVNTMANAAATNKIAGADTPNTIMTLTAAEKGLDSV